MLPHAIVLECKEKFQKRNIYENTHEILDVIKKKIETHFWVKNVCVF